MEQARQQMGRSTFVVSGQSTRYHSRQYLLVMEAAVPDDRTAAGQPPAQTSAPNPQAAQPSATARCGGRAPVVAGVPDATRPGAADAEPPGATQGTTAREIFERTTQDLPARPLLLGELQEVAAAPSIAPGAAVSPATEQRYVVVDRLHRALDDTEGLVRVPLRL